MENGIELNAFWVPISSVEKEALYSKAAYEKVDIAQQAVTVLRNCFFGAELTEEDLDLVVGGIGGAVSPAGAVWLYAVGSCNIYNVYNPQYGRYFTKKVC